MKILIVDDHGIVREGLRAVLSLEQDMEVIGEAKDGLEAVTKAAELKPDVIIIDLLMPRMSGTEAISRILENDPQQKFLALSNVTDIDKIRGAIKLGISGYMVKSADPKILPQVLREICSGGLYIQPEISRSLILSQQLENDEQNMFFHNDLSDREQEILCLIARGLSNEDIAEKLHISIRTVGVHISHILTKLNLTNRTQAAIYAFRTGLVPLHESNAV